MAKKQTMNFFEANFEKIVIALAVMFLGWVFYANILNAPGVNVSGQVVSGVDAANEAKQKANSVVASMSKPAPTDDLEKYEPVGDLLALVEPLQMKEIALAPPDMSKIIKEQDVRDYTLPEIPMLADAKIMLTHTMANVPVKNDNDNANADPAMAMRGRNFNAGRTGNTEVQDIVFVSVEATFDMEKLYSDFTAAFTGVRVDKPLTDMYTPIVASVDLLRSELHEDGSWGEMVSVPRAKIDPLYNSLNAADFANISKARHAVAMKDNYSDKIQMMLIQPSAYDLVDEPWHNPSYEAETDANGNQRDANAGIDRMRGGFRGGMGMGMNQSGELKVKDLKIWAHDDTIEPGKIYKYAIRLGFFNPCYETNWLTETQSDMKYQPVVWTNTAEPEESVQIPPVSLFIPKAIANNESARVDIYKYQNGQWFKRPFTVSVGEEIGGVATQTAMDLTNSAGGANNAMDVGRDGMRGRGGGAEQATNSETIEIEVDFSMHATVVEIKAPTQRRYEINGQVGTEMCGEIVYKDDDDGEIHSITTHNVFWPAAFREMQSDVNRAYTADERKRRDLARKNRR